jgi:uncharacterized membrane protein
MRQKNTKLLPRANFVFFFLRKNKNQFTLNFLSFALCFLVVFGILKLVFKHALGLFYGRRFEKH